jgi:osmotically-inducible protein OsmY
MKKSRKIRIKNIIPMILLALPLYTATAQTTLGQGSLGQDQQEKNLNADREAQRSQVDSKQSNGAERTNTRDMFKRDSVKNRSTNDKVTIERITEELKKDEDLTAKSRDQVTFRTSGGKIFVSGTVKSQEDLDRILLISRSHASQNPVVNELKVITK